MSSIATRSATHLGIQTNSRYALAFSKVTRHSHFAVVEIGPTRSFALKGLAGDPMMTIISYEIRLLPI